MNIIKRLREPSTWAAISVLLGLVGLNPLVIQAVGSLLDIAPSVVQLFGVVGATGAATAGVMMPERGE